MKYLTLITLLFVTALHAKTAEESWNGLFGKNAKISAAYAFVENNPRLPNVFLYGDSISIAYTPTVRKTLDGVANVYRLNVNGGDSSSVIGKMEAMQDTMKDHWKFKWDVIHFNVGLHDLKYLKGNQLNREAGKQVSSLEEYEANLRKIIAYFKKIAPKATLIFATTTPVPEGEPGRYAGDSVRYNKVALRVLKNFPEILVDDLYAFTKPNHSQWWSNPGNVHYTELGFSAQGRQVAKVIQDALKKR